MTTDTTQTDSGLPYWIDALLYARSVLIPAALPSGNVVRYSFAQTTADLALASDRNGFVPFTDEQMAYTRRAFDYISAVVNVRFIETTQTTTPMTIVFGNNQQVNSGGYANALFPFGPSSLMLNVDQAVMRPSNDDGLALFRILLHELGHSLGMKHPFEEQDAAGVIAPGPYLTGWENSRAATVMSYTNAPNGHITDFGALDLAALQFLYGVPTTVRPENNRYVLSADTSNFIWDGGGIDTIDGSALTAPLTLSLESGKWSYIGAQGLKITYAGQITINPGSLIENVIGSAWPDVLVGNDADNTLTGGGGNDTLDGVAGIDTALWSGALAAYRIARTSNGYSVQDRLGSEGTDTLTNIDQLRFADFSVNLRVQELAAAAPETTQQILELYQAFFKRTPDADGLSYWLGEAAKGASMNQLADAFYSAGLQYGSVTGYSASMGNTAFIDLVYQNVLGRASGADAKGLDYWNAELSAGATRGALVSSILSAAHAYKNNAEWGWVADLLDNRLSVARNFAVDWGLSYLDAQTAINKGVDIAAAVTSQDISAALKLIGITPADLILA